MRASPDHLLLIAGLDDVFGSYGKIGLSLVELGPEFWTIKLLLMSCRVISRGVGTVMLAHIMKLAKQAGVKLRAEFISNDRNRMMYVTYKFGGFREIDLGGNSGKLVVLENDLSTIQDFPAYVRVRA